jgi:hypothetical protein
MMPAVPPFLLKKLYQPGSLKNTPDGFELSLKNSLAPGTIVQVAPLEVDGRKIPTDHLTLRGSDDRVIRAHDITPDASLVFALNVVTTIHADSAPLSPGTHKIVISINTKEVGVLKMEFEDRIE